MKKFFVAVTLLSMSTIAATTASAQSVKPGLWEVKSSMGKGFGKGMAAIAANNKKMMAGMSAETRKEMEALQPPIRYTDDDVITKACLTKEQASKLDKMWPQKGNCKEQRSPLVGGVMTVNVSCTDPQSTGKGTIRFQGDTGFDMNMTSTTTMQGKAYEMKGTTSGKWLGADCGTIEPSTGED
jgi:transketolase